LEPKARLSASATRYGGNAGPVIAASAAGKSLSWKPNQVYEPAAQRERAHGHQGEAAPRRTFRICKDFSLPGIEEVPDWSAFLNFEI